MKIIGIRPSSFTGEDKTEISGKNIYLTYPLEKGEGHGSERVFVSPCRERSNAPSPPAAAGGTPRGPAQPRPPNEKSAGPRRKRQSAQGARGRAHGARRPRAPLRGGRAKRKAARRPRGGSHHFRANK